MLEIISPFVIILCLLIGWFLFEAINKKTDFFYRWHWVILGLVPIVFFAIVGVPEIILKVDDMIIVISAGSVIAFGFSFTASCITYKYKQWRDKKIEKAKEATVFGYKSNKEQMENKKNKETR